MATVHTAERAGSSTAATAPAKQRRKKPGRQGRQNGWVAWAFLAPFAIVFVVFLVAPLAYAFYLSLYTKGLATGERFAGFENYTRAFSDPSFRSGIWFVFRFTLVIVPVQMTISLIAALVLDSLTSTFSRFSRLVIFVPYAVPAVIGALMWGFLYSPNFGPLNSIFDAFGASAPFLLERDNLFYGLTNVVTWQFAGYYMIIIYAALQGIDPAIYEAARLDGARNWQIALRIKVPMVSSALILILVFAVIGTLQFFSEPQVLRPISNGGITDDITPNVYAFNTAFNYGQVNYASAIAFSLGIVIFIAVYIFLFATRKREGFLK